MTVYPNSNNKKSDNGSDEYDIDENLFELLVTLNSI